MGGMVMQLWLHYGCIADVKFTDGSFSGQLMMNMVNDEENVHQLQACINRRAWQQLAESLLGFFVVSNMEMNMVKQQLHVNFLDGSKAQIVAASFMSEADGGFAAVVSWVIKQRQLHRKSILAWKAAELLVVKWFT
ncbi:hypothetical protein Dimus_030910, partial [Dionaea muscipula]